jgi:hypothetical protein
VLRSVAVFNMQAEATFDGSSIATTAGMISDEEKQPYRMKHKKCYDEMFGRAS